MSRLLWLAFERPPHPDAVCHPATIDDVLLALGLMSGEEDDRRRLAGQLRRYLDQQSSVAPWLRPTVPCRRATGLYALVPWRLAKWLSVVLAASPGLIERTTTRLETWLHAGGNPQVLNATRS